MISPQVEHRAAVVDTEDFGMLLTKVWGYSGTPATIAALKLMALLYPRPGELRQATWTEFDLAQKVWTIPKERANMVAEMERRFIKQRQHDGIERAKANGVYAGDTRRIDRAAVHAMSNEGLSQSKIAQELNCSRMQVHRILNNA